MERLSAQDTISGREGRAYAKLFGNNEEMFFAKAISATVRKSKKPVKAIGQRMVGHKTIGAEGTGTMTLYYLSPLFRQTLADWLATGQDCYFDIVVENNDPASTTGRQSILLSGVSLDETLLTQLDGKSDEPLEERVSFTFEDFSILTAFQNL